MAKAVWNGVVLAETEAFEEWNGNIYFPASSVKREFIKESVTKSTCPRRGTAHYFNLEVDGEVNKDAAWTYSDPREMTLKIKGYFAFWSGVQVHGPKR